MALSQNGWRSACPGVPVPQVFLLAPCFAETILAGCSHGSWLEGIMVRSPRSPGFGPSRDWVQGSLMTWNPACVFAVASHCPVPALKEKTHPLAPSTESHLSWCNGKRFLGYCGPALPPADGHSWYNHGETWARKFSMICRLYVRNYYI